MIKALAMETSLHHLRGSEAFCGADFVHGGLQNVRHRNNERSRCKVRNDELRSTSGSCLIQKHCVELRQSGLAFKSVVADVFIRRYIGKNIVQAQAMPSLPEMLTSKILEPSQARSNTSNDIQTSKNSIGEVLLKLRNGGPGDGKIVLPPMLSAKERRRAHEIAERLGLGHVSVGQGKERCFTAWRLNVDERLATLLKILDVEEAASRASFAVDQPLQSWKMLEAQGLLLYKASVLQKEAASFCRERWILEDGIGAERAGHVSRFAQRARPGVAVRIAEKNQLGSWIVAEGQPPGRVAWTRAGKVAIVFDFPPTSDEETREICVLRVPDSTSFDRMRSVIGECERAEKGMNRLLNALLGDGISFASGVSPSKKLGNKFESSPSQEDEENALQREEAFDKGLNAEQRVAVELCIGERVSPVVLIHGPFGTGKTRTLVEVVLQQVKLRRRVLVCAASNAAVDNMALALLKADPSIPLARAGMTERVVSSVAAYTLEALQDAQPEAAIARRLRKEAYSMQLTAQKWTRAADGGERRRNARKEVNALFKDARRLDQASAATVLRRTRVLCGTLTGFASSLQDLGGFKDTLFDCVVVDEASQVITPALLLVLPYLKYPDNVVSDACFPLLVMAGDHQQLPPTVLSGAGDTDDKGGGLEATLFEELMERDGGGLGTRIEDFANLESWDQAKLSILDQAHSIATGDEKAVQSNGERSQVGYISAALRQQYRMPAQLMAFPSAAFYGGELVARHCPSGNLVSTVDEMGSILDSGLLLEVIDTAGAGFEEQKNDESLSISSRSNTTLDAYSISNPGQANLTARVVQELLSKQCSAREIGVVTPYSAQVMLLRELMAENVKAGLEIDSVDAFQGREKDTIILDTVRSNVDGTVGFLSDFHRLNVGITRARLKLIVIGDSATLSTDRYWALFFEWVSEYRERPETRIRYRSTFEIPGEEGW